MNAPTVRVARRLYFLGRISRNVKSRERKAFMTTPVEAKQSQPLAVGSQDSQWPWRERFMYYLLRYTNHQGIAGGKFCFSPFECSCACLLGKGQSGLEALDTRTSIFRVEDANTRPRSPQSAAAGCSQSPAHGQAEKKKHQPPPAPPRCLFPALPPSNTSVPSSRCRFCPPGTNCLAAALIPFPPPGLFWPCVWGRLLVCTF